jgi:hypothetical protein
MSGSFKCGADLVSVAEVKEPLTDYPTGETCHKRP